MKRDIVRTLRTQAQLFRKMENPAQGDILVRAAEEVEGLRARLAKAEAQRDAFILAIENCINYAAGRESEWGSRAVGAFQHLYDALELVEVSDG